MSVEQINVNPFKGEEFVSASKDCSFAIWNMTSSSEPIWAAANAEQVPMMGVSYHSQNPNLLLAAPL